MRSLLLFAVLGLAFGQSGGSSRFPANEDLRHVRQMAAPRLSPDGRSVLLQISDATADGGKPHLWLVDIAGNTYRQLTYSPAGDRNGETSGDWMPDGESILFLAHRGEHTQLYSLPVHGGEAHPFDLKVVALVDASKLPGAVPPGDSNRAEAVQGGDASPLPIDVCSFAIAPDGKTIAITARDPQTPGEKKQRDDKADAVEVDHDPHGTRLYLLDPATSKLTRVAVPINVQGLAWSPSSDRLIARSSVPNDAADLGPSASAWLVTLADVSHPSKMEQIPVTVRAAVWSADSRRVYFYAQPEVDAPPGMAAFHDLALEKPAVGNLSDGYLPALNGAPLALNDGAMLVSIADGVKSGVARFDPATGKFTPYHFDQPVVQALATNQKQTGWVYIGRGSTQPATLYYTESPGGAARALATPPLVPEHWRTISSKLIEWKSDGFTIQGLLYLPPEAAERKVPLIVDVHGGPTGAWLDDFRPLAQFLLGHGWAILMPNPRGSTGYGLPFAAANKNDLGGGDYRDVMAGVDAALSQFPIDPDRLGLMGYSYGGEMAGFVEGKTDRFKGIVSGAPVIDQFSEYGTEDDSWYDRWFYGKPWEHFEDAWRQSPLAGVARAKTPFLLLQGLADTVDPPGQSREMYRALRQHGVDVTLVEYPRENHGPLSGGIQGSPQTEPWHGFDARQRIVAFFQRVFRQAGNGATSPGDR